MTKRYWTTERLAQLKIYWEAGAPARELARHFPGHTWRALQNQARKIGAVRPAKRVLLRPKIIQYMKRNKGVSLVQTAHDLNLTSEQVRRVFQALRREKLIHIAGFHHVAPLFVYGPGQDITRKQWAAYCAHHANARIVAIRQTNEAAWPTIRITKAAEQRSSVTRDPLTAAFFGQPH
ncbi:hypothetical protein [Pandoraea apista]|uniref:hypothetical protein n=1 Tax=Pandoraea apista TaxID=93218 RepID=UPI000F68437A|nr:hypothetical protein [Pandoraea apista]RRW95362.1 hypothetical protein EGJ54_13195 [Pandoraea apista]